MEDYKLDLVIGQGPSARAAQDRPAALHADRRDHARRPAHGSPLRDRFGVLVAGSRTTRSDGPGEASCERSARILGVPHREADGAVELAAPLARHAAHRQPAVAARARLRARSKGDGRDGARHRTATRWSSSRSTRPASTGMRPRDPAHADREVCAAGPSASRRWRPPIAEDKGTIEDIFEPFLIQEGYLDRTPRGRVARDRAWSHFGRERSPQGGGQKSLI